MSEFDTKIEFSGLAKLISNTSVLNVREGGLSL